MNKFRNYLIGGLAVAALWASSVPATAQPNGSGTPAQGDKRAGGIAVMLQKLNLTESQKTKIKEILDSGEAGKERREAIMGVLDDSQKAKLKSLMEQARKNRPQASGTPKSGD